MKELNLPPTCTAPWGIRYDYSYTWFWSDNETGSFWSKTGWKQYSPLSSLFLLSDPDIWSAYWLILALQRGVCKIIHMNVCMYHFILLILFQPSWSVNSQNALSNQWMETQNGCLHGFLKNVQVFHPGFGGFILRNSWVKQFKTEYHMWIAVMNGLIWHILKTCLSI